MANLPAYRPTVASPVKQAVTERPLTGIGQGLQNLGAGIQGAATDVGKVLSDAVYTSELSKEQVDFAAFKSAYDVQNRTAPIYEMDDPNYFDSINPRTGQPNQLLRRDANGRLEAPQGGLMSIGTNRQDDWDSAYGEYMKGRNEYFSHGRAKQDFDSWASIQDGEQKSAIMNDALDDVLNFMDAMSLQNTNDLIVAEQWDPARTEVERAMASGAIDMTQAQNRLQMVDDAEEYAGYKSMAFNGYETEDGTHVKGYDEYEDRYEGVANTYDTIEAMGLAKPIEDKLIADLQQNHDRHVTIDRQIFTNQLAKSMDFYTKNIDRGVANGTLDYTQMRTDIRDDPNLDYSGRVYLWNMLNDTENQSSAGTLRERMEDPLINAIFMNTNKTDQEVWAGLDSLHSSGQIPSDKYYYWKEQSRGENFQKPEIFAGYKAIEDSYDFAINAAMKDGDGAEVGRLTSQKSEALANFGQSLSNAGDNITKEEIRQFTSEGAMLALNPDVLEAGAPAPVAQNAIVDWATKSDFESGLYLLENGGITTQPGMATVQEQIQTLQRDSLAKLQGEYSNMIANPQVQNAGTAEFEFTGINMLTRQTRRYKYMLAPGSEKRAQLMVFDENAGYTGTWVPSKVKSDAEIARDIRFSLGANPSNADVLAERTSDFAPNVMRFGGVPSTLIKEDPGSIYEIMRDNDASMTYAEIYSAKEDYVATIYTGNEWRLEKKIENQLIDLWYPNTNPGVLDRGVQSVLQKIRERGTE